MNITEAIAVLDKERNEQGLGMLELLVDIDANRVKYETNTRAIVLLAADEFMKMGRKFFADVDEE